MWYLLTTHMLDSFSPSALESCLAPSCQIILTITSKHYQVKELHRRCCKQHHTESTRYLQREFRSFANAIRFLILIYIFHRMEECALFSRVLMRNQRLERPAAWPRGFQGSAQCCPLPGTSARGCSHPPYVVKL